MPVETELDGIRDVGADLQKRRAPVSILDVEVVMVDRDRLPGEVEDRRSPVGVRRLWALKARIFSCAIADEHDALAAGESRAVVRHDVIFPLTALERARWECAAWLANASTAATKRSSIGRNRAGDGIGLPEVIVEEVAQAAGRLELGHVGVQIRAGRCSELESVTWWRIMSAMLGVIGPSLAGKSMMVLRAEDADVADVGPNIIHQ